MSTLLSLDPDILKTVYSYLNLHEKFSLCTTNKRLYIIFNNYPLTDVVYSITHQKCFDSQFLFNNVVFLRISDSIINFNYIKRFENLRTVDLTSVHFAKMEGVIAFVNHLSVSVKTVYVANNESREQLDLAKNVCNNRSFAVVVQHKRRFPGPEADPEADPEENSSKRLRTPSPVREGTKYFHSIAIIEEIPALPTAYQVITSFNPLPDNTDINSGNITTAIHALKDLLLNSIALSQQSNWILFTQVEFYYEDLAIDDVAMINKHERHEKQLEVNFKKCQEGRGTWYELRFTYQQLEVIATGGLFSKKTNGNKIDAFLGVAAPSHMAHDTHFVLLAPAEPAPSTSCPRTLRNYQKKSSFFKWCFKSKFFEEMGFSTPRPLKLYKTEPAGYVAISSKLINLISRQKYTPSKQRKLKKVLLRARYYKDLGFEKRLKSKEVLEALQNIRSKESTITRKLSIGKILTFTRIQQ